LCFPFLFSALPAHASEADLVLPDFSSVTFLNGAVTGRGLLLGGIVICVLGLLLSLAFYVGLKRLPVHARCSKSRN
jgi:K(+)-stimulated pyrophosphate-energized sodium pump